MLEPLRERAARYPKWTLALATLAALLPFLAKPFNIDDPLFIWAAHQIHAHPLNPYGFNVEWGYKEFPMARVTENPPLACYYTALAAGIFGWSEVGLHLAFLLPAIAVVLGTYRLARHFCQSPGLAALLTLFTPVFLVSGMTVMCDMLMLALWIWAVALWVEGMARKSSALLAGSGLLVSLAIVTKYYGVCLIPLLAAYGWILNRRPGSWALVLLIPIVTVCLYQAATASIYGSGLFGAAAHYAGFAKEHYGFSKASACLLGLTFTGGCVASAVFFVPLIWRPTPLVLGIAASFTAVFFFIARTILPKYPAIEKSSQTFVEIQMVVWALAGLSILALAIVEVYRRPDAQSWLLALWVWGTFLFAALINWTVNGRSILPMVPAAALLIARRCEKRNPARLGSAVACLAISALVSLLVVWADASLAGAVWNVSEQVAVKYNPAPGAHWFQGHWGFQYYLQEFGWSPVDFKDSPVKLGDVIAVPSNNTNLLPPDPARSVLLDTFAAGGLSSLATMNETAGAGFYSSVWGPLPFAFGRVPPESADVYQLRLPPADKLATKP
jgi:4-amino-4-deoxy-L-arabinose transferase-like glycosyltransferase